MTEPEQPSLNPYIDDTDPYDYDYQPFSQPTKENTEPIDEKPSLPPIPTTVTSHSGMDAEEIRKKALELAKREAELERRERKLLDKEKEFAPRKKPNWPICRPFLYHNIREEIPPGIRRRVAYQGYLAWFILMAALVLNHAVAWVSVVSKSTGTSDAGITNPLEAAQFIIVSALYIFVGIPGHFALPYWSLYTTMRSCHIARFFIFFICYGIAIILGLFCISGYYTYGPSGLYVAIKFWPSYFGSYHVFILNIIMTIIWIGYTLYLVAIFIQVIVVFRREKHSLKKAKEMVTGSVGYKVVSSAVTQMMKEENKV